MKTRLLTFLAALTLTLAAYATTTPETLNYKVIYKWGLVQKQAGRATFTVNQRGQNCHAKLAARSEPWADHFYRIRDTLITVFDAETRLPSSYQRIAHEDGSFAHDILSFTKAGNRTHAKCTRIRRGKKETQNRSTEINLQAEGDAVDLLSSFYYLRGLKFHGMKAGDTKTISIFSGKRKETLTITYGGFESLKIDKRKYYTYKVTFRFTSEGRKKTSEPIEAWIATDTRIPVKLVGQLKIGKIQCIYQP